LKVTSPALERVFGGKTPRGFPSFKGQWELAMQTFPRCAALHSAWQRLPLVSLFGMVVEASAQTVAQRQIHNALKLCRFYWPNQNDRGSHDLRQSR
jgi:hypothetical protein